MTDKLLDFADEMDDARRLAAALHLAAIGFLEGQRKRLDR
jgi:hypothetical protein